MRLLRGWQTADETAAPDVSFADTLPPPDETAVLRLGLSHADLADELDQERMARADAEEQVRLRDQEIRKLNERHSALLSELSMGDDLGVRSLPSLAGYLTEPFDEPIPDDARIHERSEDGEPILKGTWPAVFGDIGAHHDREIAGEVLRFTGELLAEPLHDTWTPPPPTDWDAWTGSVGE